MSDKKKQATQTQMVWIIGSLEFFGLSSNKIGKCSRTLFFWSFVPFFNKNTAFATSSKLSSTINFSTCALLYYILNVKEVWTMKLKN